MKRFILTSLVLLCLTTYLFVTAPPPLDSTENDTQQRDIPAADLFDVVNTINATARKIYTSKIVGGGKAAGLSFDEQWEAREVEAGPLPALFLREVSSELEAMPVPLGLYLGSDNPINPSNRFTEETLATFQQMVTAREPVIQTLDGYGKVGMFPDIASAKPCVSCHNEHPDTPKTDWQLGDVMGATTWTWPASHLSEQEFSNALRAMYNAVALAYRNYLQKTAVFAQPPTIGQDWPSADRYTLPSVEVFMAKVISDSAPEVISRSLRTEKASWN